MESGGAAGPRARNHHHHHQLLLLVMMVAAERASAYAVPPNTGYVSYMSVGLTQPPRDAIPVDTTQLNLAFNQIENFSRHSLPPMPDLQVLLLGRQQMGVGRVVVEDLAFAAFPRLRFLDLGGNGLLVLQPRALWGLRGLQKLLLDFDGLGSEVLEGDLFRDLASLRELDLSGNRLRRVRPGAAFRSMAALSVLNLRFNTELERVCEGDLATLSGLHLELLDLSGTRMFRDEPFDWTECGNPLRNLSLGLLDISSTTMGSAVLPRFLDSLRGVPVRSLGMRSLPNVGRSFGFANIQDPVREWFLGLEESGVEVLDFSRNKVVSLHPGVFGAFRAARTVDLSGNKVNVIAPGAFRGLASLVFLNLSHNLLGEIYKETFEDLTNSLLEHIDLGHNHIGVIQSGAFAGLARLVTLDLRDNAIQRLPELPSLSFLILRDNRLADLYGLQPGLRFLDVTRNRLRDLGALSAAVSSPGMQYLLFAENMFVYCTSGAGAPGPDNPGIVYLDLGGNAMQSTWADGSCTDMFRTLAGLEKLFLDRNLLTALPDGLFLGLGSLLTLNLSNNHLSGVSAASLAPLKSLQVLDLAWNRLVTLDPAALAPVASLRRLHLRGNPFHCTCELTPLLAWLNLSAGGGAAAAEAFPGELLCASPAGLLAVPLAHLDGDGCEEEDPRTVRRLRLALLCASSAATLLVLVAALGHRRCRGRFYRGLARLRTLLAARGCRGSPGATGRPGGGAEFSYDAFVCHSEADYPWVRSELLRRLDAREGRGGPLSVCLEARDFVPGEAHVDNLVRAVYASRCTLCVLTRRFLDDSWCMEALRLAQGCRGAIGARRDALVLLLLGSVPEFQLQKHVSVRAHLQAGRPCVRWPEDPQDRGWCADLLVATTMEEPARESPPQKTAQWCSMRLLRAAGPSV